MLKAQGRWGLALGFQLCQGQLLAKGVSKKFAKHGKLPPKSLGKVVPKWSLNVEPFLAKTLKERESESC